MTEPDSLTQMTSQQESAAKCVALAEQNFVESHLLQEKIQREAIAFLELKQLGAVPSHNRTGMEHLAPPEDPNREIFFFWAEEAKEWTVFEEQLEHWKRFLKYQETGRSRPGPEQRDVVFQGHVSLVVTSLKRAGLDYNRLLGADVLKKKKSAQCIAATYLEYFHFVHNECEKVVDSLRRQWRWWTQPWKDLLNSNVLTAQEIQAVKRLSTQSCSNSTCAVAPKRQFGPVNEEFNRRMSALAKFARDSEVAREVFHDLSRRDTLLKWILKQVYAMRGVHDIPGIKNLRFSACEPFLPHFEASVWASLIPFTLQTVQKGAAPLIEHDRSFSSFQGLPAELRRQIWLACLPPLPTVHFFDATQDEYSGNASEHFSKPLFSVRPTSAYDSGYKVVHCLAAVCSESREVLWRHFMSLKACHESKQTNDKAPDFQTFDWIPFEDLIVLRLLSKVSTSPSPDAVKFQIRHNYSARDVAIMLPQKTMMQQYYGADDDVLHVRPIEWGVRNLKEVPKFLRELCKRGKESSTGQEGVDGTLGGGIGNLYLLPEGWESKPIAHASGRANWTFRWGTNREDNHPLATTHLYIKEREPCNFKRRVWCSGHGGNGYFATNEARDDAALRTALQLENLSSFISDELFRLTRHVWNIGILGWVGN